MKYSNTMFMPEMSHWAVNVGESRMYKIHVNPCYRKEKMRVHELMDHPMLCSGTVIRTRDRIHGTWFTTVCTMMGFEGKALNEIYLIQFNTVLGGHLFFY